MRRLTGVLVACFSLIPQVALTAPDPVSEASVGGTPDGLSTADAARAVAAGTLDTDGRAVDTAPSTERSAPQTTYVLPSAFDSQMGSTANGYLAIESRGEGGVERTVSRAVRLPR